MEQKSFFITIEGIDGSGKTVLLEKLESELKEKGYSVLATKEPGGSAFGKLLRKILQTQPEPISAKAEFLLFAADRSHHFETVILPALCKGTIVISDRCADSSLAYQGYGRGVDCEMIKQINRWAMQQIEPDMTINIKIDSETALKRVSSSRQELTAFEKEKSEFWKKVSGGYDAIFAGRDNVVTIDGTQDEQTVFKQTFEKIVQQLCKH